MALDPRVHRIPWWGLALGLGPWFTFAPRIFAPDDYFKTSDDPRWARAIAHEEVHLEQQQAMGRWRWVWRYLTSKRFRFQVEVQGIAVEIQGLPFAQRAGWLDRYARMLAGPTYRYAAPSAAVAWDAIVVECHQLGFDPLNGGW